LIEVTISVVIATVLMLATAAAFSENLQAVEHAERVGDATLFLETILEDVSAVNYGNLLALDGNQLFDGSTLSASNFTVDLTVFQVEVGLLQVNAALTDLRRGRVLTRTSSLRASR
jgi:Tfp pilus assembly protein PilV